jgi:PAS domain S-box-containing protein
MRVGLALFVVHVDANPPTVVYASQLLSEFVGRPVAELVGKPPWELVTPAARDRVREEISSRRPGAEPLTTTTVIERPDGTRREIEVGVARISAAGAELAVCYFRDTTSEHAAIAASNRSEARFRSLIDHAPDGVVILQRGRIVLANPIAFRMFGAGSFEEVRGRLLSEFLLPAEAARAMERIGRIYAGERIESSEYELINGSVGEVHSCLVEHDNQPAILAFVRDVTERRRMQQQLFHADRLAALGTMAATVAHEINNPLTYLQLNLQYLHREAASEQDPARAEVLREHIANAMYGVERVARIVRDLRAYARDDQEPDSSNLPVDVTAVVDRALQMVEHDLRHRAQLVRRYSEEPAIVDGGAGRLEQVVINLLVNAIHALDGNAPADNTITVSIDVGDEIRISVADTGGGLPDPARVFEPFFTTKPAGEGTGLGLSVCKQLVERMRGRIEVVETSPRGTTLAVTLPRRTAPITRRPSSVEPAGGARLRVLVIDDEPHLCRALADLLTTEHDVDSAETGEAALAMIAAADYQVILCDLMMPRMNGRDIYEQLRTKRPGHERRIVFVTGGAFVPALASFLESVDNLKLGKPFSVENVLAVVRSAQTRLDA